MTDRIRPSPGQALHVSRLNKVYANSGDGVAGGIRDANLTLTGGAFHTLLGPSGCGKTTTLRCIAGLETPDTGTITLGARTFFDSASGISVPVNRRNIGMVFQSYAIWPHMNVFDNVAFPLTAGRERPVRREVAGKVGRALEIVGLNGFETRPATRLSGGQQQRVALARAIVREPALLLLDEPLSNLDAALREEMRRELKRLQQQVNITTVYVTHDQAEALEMSDQIAVIEAGRVVQTGTAREIYDRPRSIFVAEFIGSTNLFRGIVEQGGQAEGQGLVRTEAGEPVPCILASPATTGERMAVSVRPEAIRIARQDGISGEKGTTLPGVIEGKGFLGNVIRYEVRSGLRLLHVRAHPAEEFAVGEHVSVRFQARDALAIPER